MISFFKPAVGLQLGFRSIVKKGISQWTADALMKKDERFPFSAH